MALREHLLFGMGNPLLDIIANTGNDFLQKYDLKANDAILAEDKHMPMYDDMVQNHKVEYLAGGSSQNTMRIAQWIVKSPKTAGFMGCIGKDRFGKVVEDKVREIGVDAKYQYSETEPTGTCAVVVTKNGTNRSLCTNLAAANCFTKDHIEIPENWDLITKAEYYYITGYFLTVSPDSIMKVVEHACDKGKYVIMNLSAPFLCQFFKDPMMAAYPYVDIIFGNETEAATFAAEQNLGVTDLTEVALAMASLHKENKKRSRIVVITQGADPIIVVKDGKVHKFPVPQLSPDKIVDTNGAGDAFVGGFLAQFIQNQPLETCIRCAIWAASHIIQMSGCSFNSDLTFQDCVGSCPGK